MKNTMKKTLLSALVGAAVLAPAMAQAELSANFGVTSNYLWRGATQSADAPSVSGGIDYADESGFYAGVWVGSIDWGVGGSENDYYFGYSGESDGFGYDVGYIYFSYPATGYEDSDFGELYFNGSVGDFGFGVAYTVNSQASDGAPWNTGDLYYNVSWGTDLPQDFGLSLQYGYYTFDGSSDFDYGHIQADIAKGDFTFTLSKATDATDANGGDDLKFVVSWGASF